MTMKIIAALLAAGFIAGGTCLSVAAHKISDSDVKEGERADDSPAPCVSWVDPLTPPHAALLCIHGLGLNSGAFTNFGRRLSHRGISVYAIDVRGFGSWMKAGGSKKLDFDGTIRDIKNTLDTIHRLNPDLPVFLLGESMGGAIAIRAASLYPESIQGLISAVPAGDRFGGKKEDLKVALETLGHGFRKQFDIGQSIVNQATQNKVQQEVWEEDPLNRMDLSPLQLMQFQHFMDDNIPAAKKITSIPVLIVQGSLDKLVRPQGSWDIFNAMGNRDKSFLAFPSEHLVFEYGRTKSLAEARKSAQIAAVWIYEHLSDKDKRPFSYLAMRNILAERSNDAVAAAGDNAGASPQDRPDTTSDAMIAAEALFQAAKYKEAIPAFQAVIAAEPKNVDAHIWLGLAYEHDGQPALAFGQALQARRQSAGSHQSMRVNEALSQISADPASQPDRSGTKAPDLTDGKPTVLVFGAPWCVESSQDDSMIAHCRKYFGPAVQFKKYNIDEAASAEVVKQFGIGPIPTYVFLTPDGSVKSTQLGHSSFANFVLGVQAINH
ncbi:MAG: alpha/beta fold hydrolase [Cyanobacteria bacterium REEB67]|nr:alpha/beta fold hydrolase [Cyanobacteria bacterium REEB67]